MIVSLHLVLLSLLKLSHIDLQRANHVLDLIKLDVGLYLDG
jgi:hypothetical protein